MGFPESFKKNPILGEAYKEIGNSVCVPMVQEIAKQIKRQDLLKDKNEPQRKITGTIQQSLFAKVG